MKASARAILMEIPEYATGTRELWVPKLVKETLVGAYQMLSRVGGRVGPPSLRAAWVEYHEPGDYPPEETRTSPYSGRMTVTQMERVVCGWEAGGSFHAPWLAGPLMEVPELRDKLRAWIAAELRGEPSKELCERKKWAYRTFTWQRERAAGLVAQRLNLLGVEVWR
jgi:hypothetical protein